MLLLQARCFGKRPRQHGRRVWLSSLRPRQSALRPTHCFPSQRFKFVRTCWQRGPRYADHACQLCTECCVIMACLSAFTSALTCHESTVQCSHGPPCQNLVFLTCSCDRFPWFPSALKLPLCKISCLIRPRDKAPQLRQVSSRHGDEPNQPPGHRHRAHAF